MPGAFEYLEPQAPTPDPDVLMSGLPAPAPYSHVPTTGEVSNLSYGDSTQDRIAQGLFDGLVSMPLGGYSAGQNLAQGAMEGDPWQMAGGAAEAMFLGLPAARNLTKAGKIAPGGRGSEEMLNKAMDGWDAGADPRKIWDETGWASGKEFGPRMDNRPPEPVFWHGAPDLELRNYDPGIQRGAFADLTEGAEDLITAVPELGSLPLMARINPTISPEYMGGVVQTMKNPMTGERKLHSMGVEAQDAEGLRGLLTHETQHAVDGPGNFDVQALQSLTHGTDAERIWKALYDDATTQRGNLHSDWVENVRSGMPRPTAEMSRLSDISHGAFTRYNKAPSSAAYYNAPHEVKARMAAKVYNFGSPEQVKGGVYPGDIDAWADDAIFPLSMGSDEFNAKMGMPVQLRHYKAKD